MSRPPSNWERMRESTIAGRDLTVEARRITHGVGVNVVLDNIGDPVTFPKALASLAFQGRLVTAAASGGNNVPLDVKYLYLNLITIFGNPIDTPIISSWRSRLPPKAN